MRCHPANCIRVIQMRPYIVGEVCRRPSGKSDFGTTLILDFLPEHLALPQILEWQPSVWCSGLPVISAACRDLPLQHKSSCSLIQIPNRKAFKVYKQEQFRTYWLKAPLILLSIFEDGNTSDETEINQLKMFESHQINSPPECFQSQKHSWFQTRSDRLLVPHAAPIYCCIDWLLTLNCATSPSIPDIVAGF